LVQLFSEESLKKSTNNQLHSQKVNIALAKFKFDYEEDMSETLKEMGVCVPFTAAADFGAMAAG